MKKFLALCGASAALAAALSFAIAAQGPKPGVNSPFDPVWSIPIDSTKNTYRASFPQLSPLSASPAGLVQICGNTTSVVRVTKITVGGRATAVQAVDWQVYKRSTAGTLSSTATAVPIDTSVGAASSVPTWGTAASGTVGTLIGTIATVQQYLGDLTTGVGSPTYEIKFGHGPTSGVILRAAAQCLTVGLSQTSVGGNLLNIDLEWTEE